MIRAAIASLLLFLAAPDEWSEFRVLSRDRDPERRCEAVEKIRPRADLPMVQALLPLFADPHARVRKRAAEAAKDRAYQVRLMAALVAPKLEIESARAALASGLADADWRVRVQAIESACEVRDRSAIGPMIDLLGKEKGRLRWDLFLALRDLTGKDLGLDAPNWKRWWDANRETFAVPPKGAAGEAARPGGETGVQFFSLPILSTRMSFVLDLSGSMREPAPPVPGRPAESKLELAKREMGRTLAQLPETVWFNLLLLGCDGDGRYEKGRMSWKKTLQPATPRGRAEAASFLNRQEGKGWTNIWDGIELAFEDDLVDTIYLYTDGGASRGIFVATDDIFDELRKMNRFRKIMVHTVEVAAEKPNTADNIRLLKGLAEQTKGFYRLAK